MKSRCTKFDDCSGCMNNRSPWICAKCDAGEEFEPRERAELNFDSQDEPERFPHPSDYCYDN